MKSSGSRFGSQMPGGTFPHLQQSNLPQHSSHHQSSSSTGLPPPTFNHAFAQGNPTANVNPFAPTGNLNGLAGGFSSGGGLGVGDGRGLGSREAMEGFAHGAQLQQQEQARAQVRRGSGLGSKGQMKSRIRDVYRGNLKQEMAILRDLVERYPYISMDTEFPGIVARPMGAFTTKADYHYQTLRCNVDLLKVIQLGITLFSDSGGLPPPQPTDDDDMPYYQNSALPFPTTWQFNFQFSKTDDMYNQNSIDFLEAAGLNLDVHMTEGINPLEFASLLITSGLVMNDDVRWISFHSGYDFAYLVKLMHCQELPEDEPEYRKFLKIYFPRLYDIKFMLKHIQKAQSISEGALTHGALVILNGLGNKAGLQDIANELQIQRVGTAHQAGSDSLLTGKIFWDVRNRLFNGEIDDFYLHQVWGLNDQHSDNAPRQPTYNSSTADTQSTTPNLNGATIYSNPPNQGTPSTPASSNTGLTGTPIQPTQGNVGGIGSLTPGGGGGVFGGFRGFGKG